MKKTIVAFSVSVSALCLCLALCLSLCSCGVFSLKKSDTRLVAEEVVAQNVGYELAKYFPQFAPDVIKGIDVLLGEEDDWLLEQDFRRWTNYILGMVVSDSYVRMNFEKLVKLIEVDLSRLDQYKAKAALIRKLLADFARGMKAAAD